ncbi:MAG: PH domain-containing protein [Gordonia sp. (in: high G+C Gram-positive bacteria)]|uniref:PH domain-containing protein n=1 Tax=Gordonia sp. (in: high G+C Gram-positive bacteria) TaxID=84139 RepID=UPI003C715005
MRSINESAAAMTRRWSTPLPAAIALIGAGVALAAATAASYTDPAAMVFLGIAAAALIVTGVVSLARRPRLTLLDGPVLVVKTLRGTRTLTVDDMERVSVLHTRRIVGQTRQLAIDLPDDRLLVFGRWDLGEEPTAVAETLRAAGLPVE